MNRKSKSAEEVAAARAAIRDEFTHLSPGRVAAVITHLEMRAPPSRPPAPAGGFELFRAERPDLAWYRALYRRVGENWLWFSRLTLDDATLKKLIHDPTVQVYALRRRGNDCGILELDTRRFPDVEISFLGLVEDMIGRGAGGFLLGRALEIAWARSPRRITVHTCTLDHPRALGFYLHHGFEPYARSIEIADDPRVHGLLPRSAAPQIPILE